MIGIIVNPYHRKVSARADNSNNGNESVYYVISPEIIEVNTPQAIFLYD
ncbi:hypothetical protein [Xenorhabdus taiwanensis]